MIFQTSAGREGSTAFGYLGEVSWLAVAPVVVMTAALFLPGGFHTSNVAYHVLCAVLIWFRRDRLRGLWGWNGRVAAWTFGVGLLSGVGALVAVHFVPPGVWERGAEFVPMRYFPLFAAASFFIHVPIEEIYWRGVVLGPERGSVAVNTAFFYLLHAAPMSVLFGARGWLLGLPAAAAGGAWAFVTRRTGSLWPALLAHFLVVGLLLASAKALLFPGGLNVN